MALQREVVVRGRGVRIGKALALALATAASSAAFSAGFGDMDGPDQDVPTTDQGTRPRQMQRQRQRQRQLLDVAPAQEKRWSGSLALLVGRCLSPSPTDSSPPPANAAPCLASVDATNAAASGGLGIGAEASGAYAMSHHLTLSVDSIYEPVAHLFLVSASSAYEFPLTRRLALVHDVGIDAPFGVSNQTPGDPVTLTYTETMRLTLAQWQGDASVFADMSIGNAKPVTSNGAQAVPPLAMVAAPLQPAPPPAEITSPSRHVGAAAGVQYEISARWSLQSNLVVSDTLGTAVNPVLLNATPLGVSLRLGRWSDALELTAGTYPGSGLVSFGAEGTVRWDF